MNRSESADRRVFVRSLRLPCLALLWVSASVSLQAVGPKECVSVRREKVDDNTIRILASNAALYPCQLEISLQSVQNLKADRPLPLHVVLQPNAKDRLLVTFKRQDERQGASYNLQTKSTIGDPAAEPDRSAVYVLPFAHGKKYKLIQGYGGKFSHSGLSEFSLDFQMDLGSPVHAAREGTVVAVKSDSNTGGPSRRFNDYANYIVILHSDGTFATYAHLKQNGVAVRPGQKVAAGEMIGSSGNTGFSQGPHLHFEVSRPGVMQLESMPVVFQTLAGKSERLTEGEYLYAVHKGGPSFKPVYGKDLLPEEFASHKQTVQRKDQVTIRGETNDDTVIVFIQNGYHQPVDVELEMELTNLVSSTQMPVRRTLPALTEVFLTLLKPVDPAAELNWTVRYSIRSDR